MTELSIHALNFAYGSRKHPVFEDFNLEVGSGRTILLGPNGAGKSTLMALIATGLRPRAGSVTLRGDTTATWGTREFRRRVGWMPQDVGRIPGMTVAEQVAYHGWLKGMSSRASAEAADRAIAQVQLTELQDRKTHTLSGGQARRMGLAQALVSAPDVLLLDEPTAGLDPAQRRHFREILRALDPDLCVLVSTHQIDDLQALFEHVLVMSSGRIGFDGTVPDFLGHSPNGDWSGAETAYANLVGGAET